MGELIPTIDELKLLSALRRHKNRGIIKLIINVWEFTIEPVGNIEYVKPVKLHKVKHLTKSR